MVSPEVLNAARRWADQDPDADTATRLRALVDASEGGDVAAGAEVVGVSSDSAATHARFAEKHRLPFPIVADTDRRLRRLFGVVNPLGVIPGRVTYVIDREGVVRLVYAALFASDKHVKQALAAVGG